MGYSVESGSPTDARRARRRRALVTLAVVALLLFFAFWYAYSYYRDSGGRHTATPPTTCTRTTAPTPSMVLVNVYNATDRNGLAAKTAAEVRKRGFRIGSVSNDPLQRTVTASAEVRYGTAGTQEGKLVLALVKGSKAHHDSRTDTSVDLVLGNGFRALVAAPKTKPKPAATTATSGC